MLTAAIEHLSTIPSRSYEIIIVDDCSSDATSQTALDFGKKYPKADIRVVTFEKNRQKGGAVKHGVLHSRGRRILMADADGASQFRDLELLWKQLDAVQSGEEGVAVGSRAHLVKTEAVVKVRAPKRVSRQAVSSPTHLHLLVAVVHSKSLDVWLPFPFENCRCRIHSRHSVWFQGMMLPYGAM